LSCAENVVDAAGQPTPGPLRFWSDEIAVWSLVICEAVELSVGKGAATAGLLTSWPAATFAATWAMNESRLGGQEQGIFIPLMPSQSPVPVGFTPGETPKSGTSDASNPAGAAAAGAGAGDGDAAGAGAAAGAAVPSWRAWIWAKNVVDEAGQPTPAPCRFWSVVTDV